MTTSYGGRATPVQRIGEHLTKVAHMLIPQMSRITAPQPLAPGVPADPAQRELDAIVFLHTLRAALRVADMSAHLDPSRVEAAKEQFKQAAPDAVRLRNVFEHFDEYEAGEGRLRSVNEALTDALTFFECDVDDKEGRFVIRVADLEVDVVTAGMAANAMLATVLDILQTHLTDSN